MPTLIAPFSRPPTLLAAILVVVTTTGCAHARGRGALIGAAVGAGVGYVIAAETRGKRHARSDHRPAYHDRGHNPSRAARGSYHRDPYACE